MIFKVIFLFIFLSFSCVSFAAPNGGNVVSGSATINQNANNTNITQHTDKAIINWNSFNVNANERVNFIQPNSSSVVLNRVTGNSPSSIFGSITGNGKLFLINQNGILIGNGASIQVGSFLGSTANISDKDFLNNNYNFYNANSGITNNGYIKVNDNGNVVLLGNSIVNNGKIVANSGSVNIHSGNSFRMNYDRFGLIGVDVTEDTLKANISNNGSIDSQYVNLKANGVSNFLKSSINNSGVINATSVKSEGGKVVLLADSINHSGTIDVSGKDIGGDVLIESNNSTILKNGSIIKANSDNKAGSIKVLSKGVTNVEKDSRLEATSVYGDGGFIENSGKVISVNGNVYTNSKYGNNGTFLIDPTDIIIMKNAPSGSLEYDFTIKDNQDVSYIDMDYLNTQLASNNIVISTVNTPGSKNGDITVFGGAGSAITGTGLKLDAAGNIVILNEEINLTGSLGLMANGSIVSTAKITATDINANSVNSFIDISNINQVGNINATSINNVSLSSIDDLNINEVNGKQVFLTSDKNINSKKITTDFLNLSSVDNINVTVNSQNINAVSTNGTITIKNENDNVSLGKFITKDKDISYTQNSGYLNINKDISAGTGMINITNTTGNIYGDYDFVADNTKNMLIKANEIYLTKPDENVAEMSQAFVEHVEPTSFVDVKTISDINITSPLNKNTLNLKVTIENGGLKSNSNSNVVTLNNLEVNAKNNIDIKTNLTTGKFVSQEGNINISESDGIVINELSAKNGSVSLNIEGAGKLDVKSFESKNPASLTTVDNVEININGTNRDLVIDVKNGVSDKMSFVNGGNLEFTSLNLTGLKDLTLISKNGKLTIPYTSLTTAEKLNVEASMINDGSKFSLTSKDLIFNIRNNGELVVDAEKVDASGSNINITSEKDITFVDLNNDKLSISGGNISVSNEKNNIIIQDKASVNELKTNSASFTFADTNNGSIVGNNIDIRTTGNVVGSGRIIANSLYMRANNIGDNSNIYINANDAIFRSYGSSDWSIINIGAPSYFRGLLNYQFITSGSAFINGIEVNKNYYSLMNSAYRYSFYSYEDNNIGVGSVFVLKNHYKEKENLITVENITIPNADKSQVR